MRGVTTGSGSALRVAVLLEQCLAPVPGGTGRYAAEVARALVQEAPPTGEVGTWSAWHADVSAAALRGVPGPRRLPLPRRPMVAAWERGVGPAPRRADVVHAPTPLFPPRRGRPLVVTVHDAVPWTHPETLTPRGVRWHRAMIERAARTADAVVVPTRTVAGELARYVPLRRPPVVVGEGVSAGLVPPADAERRAAALGLPDGDYVVTLATVEPRKGLDVLLQALAAESAPDVPLLVVGQAGWGSVDVGAVAEELGIASRVRLLGRLPDEDLAVVLGRAAVLAAPSRAEGFGLPVLEAMAAGVPVVSSDAPALVEVGGGATVTVPVGDSAALADALSEVLGSPTLRAEASAAGRRRAADFSWADTARRLWELYSSLR
ncbi:glycosyltransferase family 4 protein [Blastococcus capsensis]|uniref:glycosyltransferase family 4 protein n=1 Tax=Blastococcus capsensis TaxID=1564163 RepID=UPI0025410154|nr:glycosyltransferase family 1 protein [Blastococcus capsensis]MDK3256136.1 glycosyltransferase family 1 protein [Blastococcus capsensis]